MIRSGLLTLTVLALWACPVGVAAKKSLRPTARVRSASPKLLAVGNFSAWATAKFQINPKPGTSPAASNVAVYEFFDLSPILVSAFARQIAFPPSAKGDGTDCQVYLDNARRVPDMGESIKGQKPSVGPRADWEFLSRFWSPWSEDEISIIRKCDEIPCKIKLNQDEVTDLAAAPKTEREIIFAKHVQKRITEYLKSEQRTPYEYAGGIQDPWSVLQSKGLLLQSEVGGELDLRVRQLDFLSSQTRILRQVLDVRQTQFTNGFTTVSRDLYSDHYFDSWGELWRVMCDAQTKILKVEAIQLVEFDLLKDTDFLSRISRPRMRQVVQDQQKKRVDMWFERLNKSLTQVSL